eukprot:3356917-Prymnesium_polylepis.1
MVMTLLTWRLALLCALLAVASGLRVTPHSVRSSARAHVVSAAGGDESFVVSLLDPASGKLLPCFLASVLEKDGASFGALSPRDAPVSLAEVLDQRLVPVEDETDAMVAAARAACEDMSISLLDTPVVLTVTGDGLADLDDFGDDEDEDEEDDGEEAIVLAEFDHDGRDIFVVQTLDPIYVVGKRVTENSFVIPSDSELDDIGPVIEDMVAELAGDAAGERSSSPPSVRASDTFCMDAHLGHHPSPPHRR